MGERDSEIRELLEMRGELEAALTGWIDTASKRPLTSVEAVWPRLLRDRLAQADRELIARGWRDPRATTEPQSELDLEDPGIN